jgi:hypothetical protein
MAVHEHREIAGREGRLAAGDRVERERRIRQQFLTISRPTALRVRQAKAAREKRPIVVITLQELEAAILRDCRAIRLIPKVVSPLPL